MDTTNLTFDEAFKMDEEQIIARLDHIAPLWWTKQMDEQDHQSFAQEAASCPQDLERLVAGNKRRALRTMKDVVWQFGHAALSVKRA